MNQTFLTQFRTYGTKGKKGDWDQSFAKDKRFFIHFNCHNYL